jgi:hypothetical protein
MRTFPSASAPVSAANTQQLLFVGRGLDFQLTTDQALTKQFAGTNYVITKILAIRKTGGATVACAGGIYTAAAKGGSALVAATQSWIGLSGAGKITDATLGALLATDAQSASPLYLSLTTGSTAAVTGDVLVFGVVAD